MILGLRSLLSTTLQYVEAKEEILANMQLVKEKQPLAEYYNNKSIAEQNSVDVAWSLLMAHTASTIAVAVTGSATA